MGPTNERTLTLKPFQQIGIHKWGIQINKSVQDSEAPDVSTIYIAAVIIWIKSESEDGKPFAIYHQTDIMDDTAELVLARTLNAGIHLYGNDMFPDCIIVSDDGTEIKKIKISQFIADNSEVSEDDISNAATQKFLH